MYRLWRCLEVETSNVARSCIGLLLECADYLATHHTPAGGVAKKGEEEVVKSKHSGGKKEGEDEGRGVFWKLLRNGLTANSWATRYKTSEFGITAFCYLDCFHLSSPSLPPSTPSPSPLFLLFSLPLPPPTSSSLS